MTRFYTIVEKTNAKLDFSKNLSFFADHGFDGRYLVTFQQLNPRSSIIDYRRCYFAKLDALAAEVGETRYDLHEIVKQEILEEMLQFTPMCFTTEEQTTQALNQEGWIIFIQQLELWAFTTYGVILR